MPSDSIKPTPSAKATIFVSCAHADEPDPPGQPAEGKICWLSFVKELLRWRSCGNSAS